MFSNAGRQSGGGETFLFCWDVMWCQHRRYIFRFPLMVQYNFTLTWLPIVQSNSSTNLIVLIVPPNNPRTTSNWLSKHHLYLNLHWGYPCSLNNTTLSNIYRYASTLTPCLHASISCGCIVAGTPKTSSSLVSPEPPRHGWSVVPGRRPQVTSSCVGGGQ